LNEPLKAVTRRPTLAADVVERLKEYIAVNKLQAGDRLPSQDQLAKSLGVSRAVVREAVKSLETTGILRSQHGGGVFVSDFDPKSLADGLAFGLDQLSAPQRLNYLYEARELYEVGAMKFVVERITEEETHEMRSLIAQMEKAGEESLKLDYAFHKALLRASHNPIVTRFGDVLHELFILLRGSAVVPTPEDHERVLGRHKQLLESVLSRDVGRAQAAMADHIATSKARWLASVKEEA